MRSQSITLLAALFGAVTATRCYDVGWPTYGSEGLGGLDPFGAQPEGESWDVVDAKDCFARWQLIGPDQTFNDAKVTKTVFEADESSVRSTINNYFNAGGTNIQLWLPLRTKALQYSHMLPGKLPGNDEVVDPQASISDWWRVVVSIILPRGAAELQEVYTPSTGTIEDQNLKAAGSVGIMGLKGKIETSDWAYITGTELRLAMFNILEKQKTAFRKNVPWITQPEFAYVLVEKANGDCVVLDFRNFDQFVLRAAPA